VKGRVEGLFRHPVKGFTPEPLTRVTLEAGRHFPCDRLYAVENGPSGFDASAPAHISKMRFTVLAKIPKVAAIRTRFEPDSHVFHADMDGRAPFAGSLGDEGGRAGLAAWLTGALEGEIDGPLKVVHADGHRFMDHPTKGFVSVLNLASVRAIEEQLGVTVDPARFRANITVDFGEPFIENAWVGGRLATGGAVLEVLSITRRCVATHVDPATAAVDIDMCKTLFEMTGAPDLGLYCAVASGGDVATGDTAGLA
jgi:uncharacterized protein